MKTESLPVRLVAALAGILLLGACGDGRGPEMVVPEETLPPAWMEVVSGDQQVGATGETLPEPVVVRVGAEGGQPLEGVRVTFELLEGGGSLSAGEGETGADGATGFEWTLGEGPSHRLRARVDAGSSPELVVHVTALNSHVLILEAASGEGQTGSFGTVLPAPVVVVVRDCYGEPRPGVSVSFQVTRGEGGVNPGVSATNAEGWATAWWTVGRGPVNQLSAVVVDPVLRSAPLKVEARTELDLSFQWISGLAFPVWLGQNVPSDGRTLESNHFLTFSDAASDTAKVTFATLAELGLAELLQDFAIDTPGEIGIHPGDRNTKWTIFTNRYLTGIGQRSFRYGFFLHGSESAIYDEWWENAWWGEASEIFRREIKHETMHVLQLALTYPQGLGEGLWFVEGIAEYVSGGVLPRFTSYDQVRDFLDLTGVSRLLSVRATDLPADIAQQDLYYGMFHLAVEYVLSPEGLGKTLLDAKEMYLDMASGTGFDAAFERAMGISVERYDSEFYARIRVFLEGGGAP